MNLQQEERQGFIISSEMKQVWAIQMQMTQKLLDICSKYGLKVWADGGTLLGAIREHGYIPWDDDIDLLMFREDYDKLLSVAKTEFHSPFFFQCAYTDKRYFRGHSQLRYDGTAAILPYEVRQHFHQGIFIDIFVYDSIPDDEDEDWNRRLKRADFIQDQLWIAMYSDKSILHPSKMKDFLKAYLYCLCHGFVRLYREYEDLFRYYKNVSSHRIACPCFNRKIFKTATKEKDWYSETLLVPFEGMQVPVPADFDKVLRRQYGDDYMVPRKASSFHGGFLALDCQKSYALYLKEFRRQLFQKKWGHRIEIIKRLLRDAK